MKSKVLAYYLPQFHSIPENDNWWGEGFTEWTSIKKENPISKNLLPLNNNYYNLLDKNTVIWQTELAKEYGVYGFIYYHYFFCGKKLLEKPAENLLNNKDINQKFCFCWANHDWYKSINGVKTILTKQDYGNEETWLDHFNYLLPFFKDDRYIKVDGKPLFIIYNIFSERDNLIEFFNKTSLENGFTGIYFVQVLHNFNNISLFKSFKNTNAISLREPSVSFELYNSIKRNTPYFLIMRLIIKLIRIFYQYELPIKFIKYNSYLLTKISLFNASFFCKQFNSIEIECILSAYASFDNTSRHGIRGKKISSISNNNYLNYLIKLKNIASKNNIEYIFFNAWNEWAEGMILEPDNYNEYRFLEGIKKIFK